MKTSLENEKSTTSNFVKLNGCLVVEARVGEKGPARSWDPRANKAASSAKALEEWRRGEHNLGLHLCGDVVDVDVDGKGLAIVSALDFFLPHCPHAWGRKSRPRSHRVYRLSSDFDPTSISLLKRLKRIEEVKVEIRGGAQSRGEYSLLPGSVHPSGEEYTWQDAEKAQKSSMVSVEMPSLLRAVRFAGAAAVLADFWSEGIRQELTMSLAGFLHRLKRLSESIEASEFSYDLDDVLWFFEGLLCVAGDESETRDRLKAVKATWRKAEQDAKVTGGSTLAQLTDASVLPKLYALLGGSPEVSDVDEFVRRFAVWQGPALIVDMDATQGLEKPFMSRRNFASSFGHVFISVGEKKRLLAEALWSMPATLRVQGLTFEPDQPSLVETPNGVRVNQWTGFAIDPSPNPVHSDEVTPFLDYIGDVVCDGQTDRFEWAMAWLADLFQEPHKKPGTAFVLVGQQGAGKSLLGHAILGPIIGPKHYASTNTVDSVVRSFNAAFACRVLVQCDEAINNRQRSMASKLKSIITDPLTLVEPKGVDAFFLPNHVRFFFTSNDVEDALFLGEGLDDRRYTVFEISARKKGLVREFWLPFVKWLESEGTLAKVHRYLKDYSYVKAEIQAPLLTDAKVRMQRHSWDAVDSWLASMLARDYPISVEAHDEWWDAFTSDNDNTEINRERWPDFVSLSALARDYKRHACSLPKGLHAPAMNETQIAQAMARRGIPCTEGRRLRVRTIDTRRDRVVVHRVRVYKMPSIESLERFLRERYGDTALYERLEDQEEKPRTEEF